tara:strand:- start:21906 stop:22427 length:522 start_codon:yes stop_codon:yes gene_type:complete
MAGQRLTDKTQYSDNLASDDLLMMVDVSDTTGSSAGTSKQTRNHFIIQTDKVAGNLDLLSNPLTLVAPPATGFAIQPITMTILFKYVSASTATGYVYISYDSSSTSNFLVRQRDLYKSETADRTYVFGADAAASADGTYAGNIDSKGLYLYGMNLSGTSTFDVYTTYQLIKVS